MQPQADSRFHEVYEHHRDAVTVYVRRRLPADLVEDLVAETFLVCWRKLDEVPPHEPLPWLYAVARRQLANHYRAAARRDLPAEATPADDPFLAVERDDVLARAFARLSEPDREVLRLVAWEELSLRAVARALDCSQVACRVRFHRARRRLASHLKELEAPDSAPNQRSHPKGATS
jgi:RNA polymerase sigma factor (sigma-70 family)